MSTCVLLIQMPESLSVYSDQLNRMFTLGSLGFWIAGCTSPPVASLKTSFWPYEKYTRPENFGIRMVTDWPLAGPGIDASGAGIGGTAPPGQGWKVPPASAQPCWPVASRGPRSEMKTGSFRP